MENNLSPKSIEEINAILDESYNRAIKNNFKGMTVKELFEKCDKKYSFHIKKGVTENNDNSTCN